MKYLNANYLFKFFVLLYVIVGGKQLYKSHREHSKLKDKLFSTKVHFWKAFMCVSFFIGLVVSIYMGKEVVKIYSITNFVILALILETFREALYNRLIIGSEGIYVNKYYFKYDSIKSFGFGYNKKHGHVVRLYVDDLGKGSFMDYIIEKDSQVEIKAILQKNKVKEIAYN